MNTLIRPSLVLILPLLFFYKEDVGIKWPLKVYMPLTKEIEIFTLFQDVFP